MIVACFASHVHRVQQVLDAAARPSGQVALVGRSMVRNMGIARDLGLLHGAGRPAGRPARGRAAAVAAGPADLDRLAGRAAVGAVPDGQPRAPDDPVVQDDTIVLASSLIPGNENAVGRVINGLSRLGATVVHKSTALVHVSGPRAGR